VSERGAPQSSERTASVGKYRLIASLGRGGMADVYLAVVSGPAGFNKLQVLKLLRPHLAPEPEFVTMFLDEARLAARLNHPNVVQTNEVGEANGGYFIAMEYLEGQPLSRVIREAPQDILLRITADALAGLHYAHELADYDGTPLEVVHRDASPHNIFVGYDGQVKLVDFGIAKASTSSSDTMVGMIKGKVAYMSPEQASGTKVDRRSDVFSMGIVLWEALARRRIWAEKSDLQIIHDLALGVIPVLSEVVPDIDRPLAELCQRALTPSRDDRYGTAQAFREAILSYLESRPLRPSQEEVGTFVATMFAEKRETIRGLVEQQLRELQRGTSSLRIVDVETGSLRSGPVLDPGDRTPTTESQARVTIEPSSGRNSAPHGGLVASQRPPENTEVSALAQRRSSGLRWAAGAVLAIGILGGGAYLVRSSQGQVGAPFAGSPRPSASLESVAPGASVVASPSASPSTSATPASADSAGAAAPLRVEMRFAATPATARLLLDDRLLPGNPYTALVEADGATHRLRVEAVGFVTETRDVLFEPNGRVELSLAKEPPQTKTKPGTPPVNGAGVKRTIDKANPWGD
jgi:eukaryotic-like serine/threonine-protein kinase